MTDRVIRLAVIMERALLANKWADERWEAIGVVPDASGEKATGRRIHDDGHCAQWLYPGLELQLYPDEAENYLLNVTAPEPRVFVMWRMEDELARPGVLTVSYGSCKVSYTTHAIGGLSDNDFICAAKVDRLAAEAGVE